MSWTKQHPKEEGYYWYFDGGESSVVFYDHENESVLRTGCDTPLASFMGENFQIDGDFWDEKLTPPISPP